MLIRACTTILLLIDLVPAQDAPKQPAPPNAASTAKVAKALRATAESKNTAFDATWGPERPKQGNTMMPAALLDRMGGKVAGAFFDDRLSVVFDNKERDELLQVGRHILARSGGGDWRLRKGRYADGNEAEFVPDPPLLLRMLSSFELPLTKSAVAALDDRPVEIASATLTPEQIGELIFAGALPKPFAATTSVRVGAAGRAAASPPDATVDLAIVFDPATSIVHRVLLRTNSKSRGGSAVMLIGPGGRPQVANAGESEKKEEQAAEPAPGTPMEYVEGLPVRPSSGRMITNFEVRLHDHGKVAVPVLDDQQQRLLGR
jgi:hypothetical protein